MKKAYELSTLTGTQVMLLVASETGHVYTFATKKLQPMITSEAGKALIQTCLNSPEEEEVQGIESEDQRMSAAGFEETDLNYAVEDSEPGHDPECGGEADDPGQEEDCSDEDDPAMDLKPTNLSLRPHENVSPPPSFRSSAALPPPP